MTNEEILKKAIEKAANNGWYVNDVDKYIEEIFKDGSITNCIAIYIIFSHDFAKAFWGEEKNYSNCGLEVDGWEDDESHCWCNVHEETKYPIVAWQYHLQQMVLEEEPIKYLEKFI